MRLDQDKARPAFAGMGPIERTIAKVSPAWAIRRYANRQKLQAAERAYESIENTRLRRKRQDARGDRAL